MREAPWTQGVVVAVPLAANLSVERDGNQFHVFCDALPGLHIGGETEEIALMRARDGVRLYIESVIRHGQRVPFQPTD